MAAGKRFASDFQRIDAVKPADKLLIQDSADGVVKFAFPTQLSAINGWRVVESIDKLPANPARKDIGYIVGDDIYFWVGADGDTLGGKYQKANIFKGENGVSSFVHIAYSNSADGSADFSITESEGRSFLGIYVDIEAEASTNPTAYKWSKIKGDAGTPAYVHIAYADSADGTEGFSTTDSLNKAYLGIYTDSEVTGSNNPAAYKWMRTKGEDGNGGGAGIATLQMEATYAELVQMATDGQLIKGMRYRMTDYETMTSQSGTTSAGHPFDLILTALDEYSFSERCSAVRSARDLDGYFAEHNIGAWDVWYDIANNQERFAWAVTKGASIGVDLSFLDASVGVVSANYAGTIELEGVTYAKWDFYLVPAQMNASFLTTSPTPEVGDTTAFLYAVQNGGEEAYEPLPAPIVAVQNNPDDGKGVIFRMIDENRNDCGYDFKNIQFFRKLDQYGYIVADEGNDTAVYTFGFARYSDGVLTLSDFSRNAHDNTIIGGGLLPNNVLFYNKQGNEATGDVIHDNHFAYMCKDNTIANGASSCSFGYFCSNNDFFGAAYNCTLGEDCANNKFYDDTKNLTFGNRCLNNRIDNTYNYTVEIILGNACEDNIIKGSDICLGDHSFQNNIDGGRYIVAGSYFNNNFIGQDSANLIFGEHCNLLKITNCRHLTMGSNNIGNGYRYIRNAENITIGNGCVNINIEVGVIRFITIEDNTWNIDFSAETPGTSLDPIKNYRIKSMASSRSNPPEITIPVVSGRDYYTTVALNKAGEVVEYTIDDILNS